MTDDEIKAAAEYYGAMKWTSWIKVEETRTVPKTYTSVGMYLPLEGNAKEALGERIIEMPLDAEATEGLRNPRSGFIAYAPIGSIKEAKPWSPGIVARPSPAEFVMGPISKASALFPASLAGRPVIWCASCMTSSKARGTAIGPS
jgi:hypothetical protein